MNKKKLLKKWFTEDTNAIPKEYSLRTVRMEEKEKWFNDENHRKPDVSKDSIYKDCLKMYTTID